MLATCPGCGEKAYHEILEFQTEARQNRFKFECYVCDHEWWSDWQTPPEE